MNTIETVEYLTNIVARQAYIIRELFNVVEQLNATTSLDTEIKAIQAEVKTYNKLKFDCENLPEVKRLTEHIESSLGKNKYIK